MSTVSIILPETRIELQPAEVYAGAPLNGAGGIKHHTILLPARPDKRITWDEAVAWAISVGGVLPSRQEQALLLANCRAHLKPVWHWSSEEDEEDASYAWGCGFTNGDQFSLRKSWAGSAVAVRRLVI